MQQRHSENLARIHAPQRGARGAVASGVQDRDAGAILADPVRITRFLGILAKIPDASWRGKPLDANAQESVSLNRVFSGDWQRARCRMKATA
jgi:hypothetical protein